MKRKTYKDAPLLDALISNTHNRYIPFHMPGHKLGNKIPGFIKKNIMKMDVTELSYSDNLHLPEGVIKEAQDLAAKAYGAEKTFFLVNGSTSGILSSIASLCGKNDTLIVTRDCHKAVVNAMTLFDINPVYVKGKYDKNLMIPYPSKADDIINAINENPNAKGVFITSPNYYGVSLDVDRIIKAAHLNKMAVIVDEAHGAHFNFSTMLPKSSAKKADICIQSAHKTLPVFTQGSYMHVNPGHVNYNDIKYFTSIFLTSSPSYMIMAMLDYARALMEHEGASLIDKLCKAIDGFINTSNSLNLDFFTQNNIVSKEYNKDKTRIVINTIKNRTYGYDLEIFLRRKFGIYSEMADMYNVILIACVHDREKWFNTLYKGLKMYTDMSCQNTGFKKFIINPVLTEIPKQAASLSQAAKAKGEMVNIDVSCNRISKKIVAPYPPGIPVLCPGERISSLTAAYLCDIIKNGGFIEGIDKNNMIEVLS